MTTCPFRAYSAAVNRLLTREKYRAWLREQSTTAFGQSSLCTYLQPVFAPHSIEVTPEELIVHFLPGGPQRIMHIRWTRQWVRDLIQLELVLLLRGEAVTASTLLASRQMALF